MLTYSFPRYLTAKRTVDDRALNPLVWETLAERLRPESPTQTWQVLEIGGGTGTMLQRLVERGTLRRAAYTLIDEQAQNIASAEQTLPGWARALGMTADQDGACLRLDGDGRQLEVTLLAQNLFDFLPSSPEEAWDLIVANAFLDLVDAPAVLPRLANLARPGGLLLLTINFDGLTILEPQIDPRLDEKILRLYHESMDQRITAGLRSGDSRTGRRLFSWLRQAGLEILQAGSSDWAVFSRGGAYPADEAYFLHFILHFFEESLTGHPELAHEPFADWLARRHEQVERGELVYIAHQMDFLARRPG